MDPVCRSADAVDECWRGEALETGSWSAKKMMKSSRDHERRTFHGPSSIDQTTRRFFFGLHRRCALPSYWRIAPTSDPFRDYLTFSRIIRTSLFSFHNKFTSSTLHVYYLLDSIQYQYQSSLPIVSFFLFPFSVLSIRNLQLHTYTHTFRAYFILYR